MSNERKKYIDWCQYMSDPGGDKPKISEEYDPKANLYWQDSITNMIFYIPFQRLKETNAKALKYMKDNLKNDIDKISRYLCLTKSRADTEAATIDPDVALFPHMPYSLFSGDNITKLPRISDVVAIRTALLYALCWADGMSSADKICIRRYGLLKNINLYVGKDYDAHLNWPWDNNIPHQVDKLLCGGAVDDSQLPKFDVVKGSSVKIKQYYLETNKLQNIRGASIILDDIIYNIIPEIVARQHIPESFICSGGGNVYIIVPEGSGKQIAELIERTFENYTITAQSVAVSRSYNLCELANDSGFKNAFFNLDRDKTLRQYTKINWQANPPMTPELEKNRAKKLDILFDKYEPSIDFDRETDLCDHCRIRIAAYRRKGTEDEKLCPSCAARTAIGNEGRSIFIDEYERFCDELKINIDKNSPIPNSIDDIGTDKGHIAVLYGDGNNMGNVVENIKSLTELRYFSMKTEQITKTAAYKALGEIIGNRTFEIISLGGDDMMMILPARKALLCAVRLGRYFDNAFCNWSDNLRNITLSIGIAISHSKTPIQQLSDISHDLLASAKNKAQKLADSSGKKSGTVDIAVMESFASFSTDINDYRNKTLLKRKLHPEDNMLEKKLPTAQDNSAVYFLTMRPYTWDDAEAIIKAISILKKDPTTRGVMYDMRHAVSTMSMMEAQLYNLYRYVRLADEQHRLIDEAFQALQDGMHLSSPMKAYFVKEGESNKYIYSPFVDLVELWDYAG